MDLTSPKTIKEILSKYEAKPSKGLGQNFLIDKRILSKIIESADIKPSDTILEVGPGIGVLTRELAERAGRVISVEKDETMVSILKETLADLKNVEVVNEDILEFTPPQKYKVVANIPYYLTSPLIRRFLEFKNPPEEIILMIQKEVAKRICSNPPDMSLLAVSVQFYAEPKIISYVSKNCFLPSPKVDSAIIKIVPNKAPTINPETFFEVVKAGFSHPRKQLVNNLTTLKDSNEVKLNNLNKEQVSKWLLDNNIKPTQRPETLSVSDWVKLTNSF